MKLIRSILATDCGSTTTKCILIERIGDGYRQTIRGEAPTTVEAPFEDVTMGVINGAMEVEELSHTDLLLSDGTERKATPNRRLLRKVTQEDGSQGWEIIVPQEGDDGVDAYISTSSAGGGLQMIVAGLVQGMSGESAQRAALGAGAIVLDVLAANDGRLPHQKIDQIRHLRPDMILQAGGTDGGNAALPLEMAEMISAAKPQPRLGMGFKLPIIYAGNNDIAAEVQEALGSVSELTVVENLRPTLERENLNPARDRIHDLFMEHVMKQAPGYDKLMDMCRAGDENGQVHQVPIMPTPGAVGRIIETIARINGINVVGVDIGGATTDVFSVFGGVFNRTVSANLGMSYSVSNVLVEAGIANVKRWVSHDIDENDLRNRIGNKMIRPTTIPQTMEELEVEQAIAREALRLSFIQHKNFAVELKGVQQERTISDAFAQDGSRSLVKMMALDLLVGSGGVLSHAPERVQTAWMLVDSFLPEGITRLAVDSIFMMPHLGVLSSLDEEAATQVFDKDCMIYLGTCIAPVGKLPRRPGSCLKISGQLPNGSRLGEDIATDELRLFPLALGESCELLLQPARGFDLGAGPGKSLTRTIHGGVVGLVVDTRGRPFTFGANSPGRLERLSRWNLVKQAHQLGMSGRH
ncbi:MAG: glutamate mutase L [Calditrichaeota bacterium]|nr:glutamate mutase L [Candidatus Cloacimonadota bacterium]MCB1046232.1 glutamate mutase L [Calditrichota bacterium]MCB9474221.1 glutamate mutase L [Candidatus Delongbacteria bacterium]